MKREIKTTGDGSKTLYINELNESYHSHHGALQEAEHVFINNGLKLVDNCQINILELGFGTGLNVLVTINEFLKTDKNHSITYYTLEKYPVDQAEVNALDYAQFFTDDRFEEIFAKIHAAEWHQTVEIIANFHLHKFQADFFQLPQLEIPPVNLVYFDCFGASVQPDLWEQPLLQLVADKMAADGLFTTYSSKGSLRRSLKDLGFAVEKKQGPPGKREMINAIKMND